jgi:hypothetical protein
MYQATYVWKWVVMYMCVRGINFTFNFYDFVIRDFGNVTTEWYFLFFILSINKRYNWNIVESGIKHHKPTKPSIN